MKLSNLDKLVLNILVALGIFLGFKVYHVLSLEEKLLDAKIAAISAQQPQVPAPRD
jgi:hypothetical protein